jgi:hypothetical protein
MHSHNSLEFTVDGQERMEEYLFGEIPADLSLSGKLMFYLIRLSEGMIIYGVFSPWLESRAFGAQQSGWDLGDRWLHAHRPRASIAGRVGRFPCWCTYVFAGIYRRRI